MQLDSDATIWYLQQCDLLRALAELEAKERAMYELKTGAAIVPNARQVLCPFERRMLLDSATF